ncbi:MAG: prepilin peptidase, partial [Alphaproteobacteria bacterium]|nr:prepilin peptidase [Alphaproteobacteria bacterium]
MAFIPFAFLLALLVVAAAWDVASFTIPNTLQLGLVLAFIAFALLAPLPLSVVGMHVLAGLTALALGFTLFALGYVGGGDAKLLAAVALWLGFGD